MKKILFISLAMILALSAGLIGCGGGEEIGGPVTVKMLIRTEDVRADIGDYVGNQLEDLGFTVERQYGTSSDLSSLWLGDPTLGLWNGYTGAWINTAVPRDEGSNFGAFYTPLWSAMGPLWAAYTPTAEFLDVATALWNNDFTTMAERQALFEDAVPMSMNDSVRIFVDDRSSFYAQRANVATANDAYGGTEGSRLWAHALHFQDSSGVPLAPTGNTTMRVATGDLLVDPWNPVAGSNWAYDQLPIAATQDHGCEYDTNDGLAWAHVIDKAEVTVLEGLPVGMTSGHETWLTLDTSPNPIPVPETAWADWDALNGQWITAGAGVTADTKTVVYYPEGTLGRPLHDGSTLDEGDFLFYTIMEFDRAKADSPIYDPAFFAEYEAFMAHFKGFTFNFTAPGYDLVITTYDDQFYMDAELIAYGNTWYPTGSYGPYAWHTLALGWLADRDGVAAFGQTKATTPPECDWLSMISGPSLAKLAGYLDDVQDDTKDDYRFLPYANVLGDYITESEIDTRYSNLKTFYDTYGHFWVATGPYYLDSVDTSGNVIELHKFASYPDDGGMWFFLLSPATGGTPGPTEPYPANNGAWADIIVLTIEEETAAVTKLQSDDLDLFAHGMSDPDLFETVQDDVNLSYYMAYGLFDEITFNPSGPFFPGTGKLNPFAIPEVRQALNWAIDRSYIAGEIFGGMAAERYTTVGTVTGDYINRYPSLFAATEAEYAYDFNRADAAIEAAMLAIDGVTRDTDGKYIYTP